MLIRQSYYGGNSKRFYIRLFYDVTIFLIINVVFMNIIFGIIIDTFAVLRDENKKKEEDIKNICFVCSLNRTKIEKQGKDFKRHVKKEHHIWNYLFYIYFLIKKDHTEYDGIESYVQKCLETEDIHWMPIKKALSVQDSLESDEQQLELNIDLLLDKLDFD